MENYYKYDFKIQRFCLIAGVILGCITCESGIGVLIFYVIVGVPQLLSFIFRMIKKDKITLSYKIYGFCIIPIWITILMIIILDLGPSVSVILYSFLIISLIYSPILSVIYVYDLYKINENNINSCKI